LQIIVFIVSSFENFNFFGYSTQDILDEIKIWYFKTLSSSTVLWFWLNKCWFERIIADYQSVSRSNNSIRPIVFCFGA